MRLFCILLEVKAESREIGSDRRLSGRGFVQALERVIQFFEVVICAIEPAKRIEGLTAHGRILCDAQPQ